jgi:hypothetical protein
MGPTISAVIEAFNLAQNRADLIKAERMARDLNPHDQLAIVDALLAADARLKESQ